MPENGMPGPVCDLSSVKESVCIHTKKILDGCRDKDCVEDLRFYPTQAAQEVLSGTQIIKGGCAELLYVYTDVEPITFNRGFYSIDMRYFYRVTLQVATGTPRSTEVEGLCVFDKRCILFGSEGSAKSFSSDTTPESIVPQTGLPTAVVEAVDPIVLDTRIVDGARRLHGRRSQEIFPHDTGARSTSQKCLYRDGKKFRIKFFWIKMLFFIFECIYLAALLKTSSKILFWINVLLCFVLFICIYIERPICKMHFKIIMKRRKKKNEYITNRNSSG